MPRARQARLRTGNALATRGRVVACLAIGACLTLVACSQGDFDQRLRADIEETRQTAFTLINSNPQPGLAIYGSASSGGLISNARVTLYPINPDGTINRDPAAILGNSITRGDGQGANELAPTSDFTESSGDAVFVATMRKAYRGPVIVELTPTTAAATSSNVAFPALGMSFPRESLQASDALLGYAIDYPYGRNARSVSPLTTLVVERALFLGGISSGNLNLASRQVGAFFGLDEVRAQTPHSLMSEREAGDRGDSLQTDLALAIVSQLARETGARQADVWRALTLDIRDDGELNGTSGLIPGTGSVLPSLARANYVTTQLLNDYLDDNNAENLSGIVLSDATDGSLLLDRLTYLDTARTMAGTTLELLEANLERYHIGLIPGQETDLGVRGFSRIEGPRIEGTRIQIVTTDGPTVANLSAISEDPSVAQITSDGRVRIPDTALPGTSTLIRISLAADGIHLTGSFSTELVLRVTVASP